MESINVIKSSKHPLPQYETEGSVGMDLRAWVSSPRTKTISDCFIQSRDGNELKLYIRPMGRAVIDTGLKMQLPSDVEGVIRNRSGMTARDGLVAQIGTIDSDYRGSIMVTIINFGDKMCEISDGDRIAQIVFHEVKRFSLNVVDALDETARGAGGHGHTGVR